MRTLGKALIEFISWASVLGSCAIEFWVTLLNWYRGYGATTPCAPMPHLCAAI
jgi:hypothetical protein